MANPPSSPALDWKMYRYTPSLPLAILFLALFLLLSLIHLHAYIRYRKSSTIYVILGGLCEVAGFAARIGSHYNNEAWAPFIMQGILLLLGPLFFAATVYMMLGRTIRRAGASDISRISPKLYTRIFVTADISTLVVQGLGASLMGTMKVPIVLAGEKIVIAGLALQIATFIAFLVAAIDFSLRVNRTLENTEDDGSHRTWKTMLLALYTLSGLILFRGTFRLIEYSMGNASYLIAHEWTLYTFDAVPMFVVIVLLFVFERRVLDRREVEKLDGSSDAEMAVVGN